VSIWFGVPTAYVFCDSHYVFHHHVHTYIVHDHRRVRFIGEHTHVYRPAPGRHYWGPPARVARIPASAVPRQRVAADPRAIAAARRQTSARVIRRDPVARVSSTTRSRAVSSPTLGTSQRAL